MASIEVRLFGPLRDRFGSATTSIELPENARCRDVLELLGIDVDTTRVALDGHIVPAETPVGSANEIACLPPVSGG